MKVESNFTLCKKNICNYYLKHFYGAVATLRAAADPRSGLLKSRSERAIGEGEKRRKGEGENGAKGRWGGKAGCIRSSRSVPHKCKMDLPRFIINGMHILCIGKIRQVEYQRISMNNSTMEMARNFVRAEV